MPDYSSRSEFEASLTAALEIPFSAAKVKLESGSAKLDLYGLQQDIQTAVAPELLDTFTAVYLFMLDSEVMSPQALSRARGWASATSTSLSNAIISKAAARLSSGVSPASIFSQSRAVGISITEVTRAISAAEAEARREAAKALPAEDRPQRPEAVGPLDVPDGMVAIWWTERDGHECKVCRAFHRQPYPVWRDAFPYGPPAHPHCRCWKEYESLREAVSPAFSEQFRSHLAAFSLIQESLSDEPLGPLVCSLG
jgi:hypothetical protein